jgi:hypothetical protein
VRHHRTQKEALLEVLLQASAGGFLVELGRRVAREEAR